MLAFHKVAGDRVPTIVKIATVFRVIVLLGTWQNDTLETVVFQCFLAHDHVPTAGDR